MIHKAYAILDSAVESYMQPFFARTAGEALRWFEDTVNGKKGETPISQHPKDFALFEIAEYDDKSGRFTQYEALKPLCTALEVKREQNQQSIRSVN